MRLRDEELLAEVLTRCASLSLIDSAHDLSEGGLAQALVESVLINGVGATVGFEGEQLTPFTQLFSESTARAVITTDDPGAAFAIAEQVGFSWIDLGETGGDALVITDLLEIPLDELRAAFEGTLPALFG